MNGPIKIPAVNDSELRIVAVSSMHVKCSISEADILEDENKKKYQVEKNEAGISTYWIWEEGQLFPEAMVKLSGAKITPRILKDYGIKKIYFFLVKPIENE